MRNPVQAASSLFIFREGEGESSPLSWPLANGSLGGWGGGAKNLSLDAVFFFVCASQGSCLLIPLLYLPKPFSSPIRKLLVTHALPQPHEPPYPPLLLVLIARNLSRRIAMHNNLKNPTYSKMEAPPRSLLLYFGVCKGEAYLRQLPHILRKRLKCVLGIHQTSSFCSTQKNRSGSPSMQTGPTLPQINMEPF